MERRAEVGELDVYAVISTIGFVELNDTLKSLIRQSYPIREIVVVDQSGAGLDSNAIGVREICASHGSAIKITYVRDTRRGASRGRNAGLDLLPRTGLVFFPDDDAIYDDQFVARLVDEIRGGYHFCAGVLYIDRTLRRGRLPGRFLGRADITIDNVLWAFCEATILMRLDILADDRFDENIGVGSGTWAGGDEGADLVIRLIRKGARGVVNPLAMVFHPDKSELISEGLFDRARLYSIGRGLTLRRHRIGWRVIAQELIRPIAAMLLWTVRLNFGRARYYRVVLNGKISGYVRPARALAARRCGK